MSDNIKHYELSVWNDMAATPYKMFTLASDTMESPIAAYNIVRNRKVNGEVTLTFSVNARYFNQETGEYEQNPYIQYLINERTIKLKRETVDGDIEWFDFAIKDVQQDSQSGVYNFTAKDLWVQELAKNGFSLEFSKEQRNNTDTAKNLAEKILEGTGWKVDDGDFLLEYSEEPVWKGQIGEELSVYYLDEKGDSIAHVLPKDSVVYIPYSILQTPHQKYFQFIASPELRTDEDDSSILIEIQSGFMPERDDENVLLDTIYTNYYVQDAGVLDESNRPAWLPSVNLLSDVRGRCLSFNIEQTYDPNLEKYVTRYTKGGKEYYGFVKTEYLSPETVFSLIDTGKNFENTSGWFPAKQPSDTKAGQAELIYVPEISAEEMSKTRNCYLKITDRVFNNGILSNRSMLTDGFTEGEKYIFHVKGRCRKAGTVWLKAREYEILDGYYTHPSDINGLFGVEMTTTYEGDALSSTEDLYAFVTCQRTITAKELKDLKIGFFVSVSQNNEGHTGVLIEEIELYRAVLKKGKTENSKNPGDYYKPGEIETDPESLVLSRYYYYDPDLEHNGASAPTDIEEIKNLAADPTKEDPNFEPIYNTKSEKKRTISGKETNRFDLLQKICESFECWMRINIKYDEYGYVTGKSVSFHEYTGDYNYAGFRYGINLKSIKRQLDSKQIVTKMIVKDNSNEFAKNGFCSITRAPANPSGTNVVYDFGYFEHQGICNMQDALYNSVDGLYPKLKAIANVQQPLIEQKTALEAVRVQLQATVTTYEEQLKAAEEEEVKQHQDLVDLTTFTLEQITGVEIVDDQEAHRRLTTWQEDDKVLSILTKIYHLQKAQKEAKDILENNAIEGSNKKGAKNALAEVEEKIAEIDKELDSLREDKLSIENEFYQKYSRFIQEGFWISEDYTDDTRYYLDSLATAYTSSRPKITYTIDVFEMSKIEGYENYRFNVGDKTFVEDPEFFGWKDVDVGESQMRTPRQEEVIISEISDGIDDSTKNTIKVQNYKTQFDDLFQRIAATTEQLQYTTGRYERSAQTVNQDGSLKHQLLQEAVTQNGLTIAHAGTQSVSVDERGVITIDQKNPNKQIRMIGGGLFVSNDGGETWRTGVTGDGINADVMTTGQLNAGQVNIVSGKVMTHRWDDKGITAYETTYTNANGVITITKTNNANFVRFDEFGIYGIEGNADFDARVSTDGRMGIDKIENADEVLFSLTQNGMVIGGLNGLVARKGSLTIGGNGALQATAEGITIGGDNGLKATQNSLTIGNFFQVDGSTQTTTISGWVLKEGYFGNADNSLQRMWLAANGYSDGTTNYSIYVNGKFKVTPDGKMYATDGEIAGWTIEANELSSAGGEESITTNNVTTTYRYTALMKNYISSSNNLYRSAFCIRKVKLNSNGTESTEEGAITYPVDIQYNGTLKATQLDATGGNIAGWTIKTDKLSSEATATENNVSVTYTASVQKFMNTASARAAFSITREEPNKDPTYPFQVKYDGSLHSTKGDIGGWTIGTNILKSSDGSIYLAPTGYDYVFKAGNNFKVTSGGTLTCFGAKLETATVSGKLTAGNNSEIGGWTVTTKNFSSGTWGAYVYNGSVLESPKYQETQLGGLKGIQAQSWLSPQGVYTEIYHGSETLRYFGAWTAFSAAVTT